MKSAIVFCIGALLLIEAHAGTLLSDDITNEDGSTEDGLVDIDRDVRDKRSVDTDGGTDDGLVEIDEYDSDARNKRTVTTRVIVNEMSTSMSNYAKSVATTAVSRYTKNSSIAVYIRVRFDLRYGTNWQCIVGNNYGFSIHKKSGHYIFFRAGAYYISLFKSP